VDHNINVTEKTEKSMKRKFIYLFAVIFSMSLLTACSDDDDNVKIPNSQTTFTTEEGLILTVNGDPMVGKVATFTPATASSKASITLSGEALDLSALIGGSKVDNQPSTMLQSCGVIPGSPEVTIPVDVLDGEFSGSYETDYCTFNYAGELSKNSLQMGIADLQLKNKALVGTSWKPVQPHYNDMGMMEGAPYINWISSATFTPGFPPNMLATMMCSSAFIPFPTPENPDGTIDIENILVKLLQDVTFDADGNIIAHYTDSETFQPKVSPKNIIQYVLVDNKTMKLYINPQLIIYDVMQSGRAADMSGLISVAMNLVPMLSEGIPAQYRITDNVMTVYLDTEMLLPLLKAAAPMFEDEDFVKMIMDKMPEDMSGGFIGPLVEGVLKSLPAVAEGTTVFEIGLNLEKVN